MRAVLYIRRIGRTFFGELGRRRATIRVDFFIRIMSGPVRGHARRIALAGLGSSFKALDLYYYLLIWYFRVFGCVVYLSVPMLVRSRSSFVICS